MTWAVRIELHRAPDQCAKTCWGRAGKPHLGPCASAEGFWKTKPTTAQVRKFLTGLLRSQHPARPGDKLQFTKALERHIPKGSPKKNSRGGKSKG